MRRRIRLLTVIAASLVLWPQHLKPQPLNAGSPCAIETARQAQGNNRRLFQWKKHPGSGMMGRCAKSGGFGIEGERKSRFESIQIPDPKKEFKKKYFWFYIKKSRGLDSYRWGTMSCEERWRIIQQNCIKAQTAYLKYDQTEKKINKQLNQSQEVMAKNDLLIINEYKRAVFQVRSDFGSDFGFDPGNELLFKTDRLKQKTEASVLVMKERNEETAARVLAMQKKKEETAARMLAMQNRTEKTEREKRRFAKVEVAMKPVTTDTTGKDSRLFFDGQAPTGEKTGTSAIKPPARRASKLKARSFNRRIGGPGEVAPLTPTSQPKSSSPLTTPLVFGLGGAFSVGLGFTLWSQRPKINSPPFPHIQPTRSPVEPTSLPKAPKIADLPKPTDSPPT